VCEHKIVHNWSTVCNTDRTVLTIFPLIFKKTTIAQMWSIGEDWVLINKPTE